MDNVQILWVDDEIDLLKSHIIFLNEKGYKVDTVGSGSEALEMVEEKHYDLVLLDENMPGIDGLETLKVMKTLRPALPVVMITKSEEESIMDDAIGSQISDYLIKPVNPKQILLVIKKNLDVKRLVSEKTINNYREEFRQIATDLATINDVEGWKSMYKRLVYWELELDKLEEKSLNEILQNQKKEANSQFFKFIERNYENWLHIDEGAPVMSHTLFKKWVYPQINEGQKLFFIVIDNLRYDQWKIIQSVLLDYFQVKNEETYFSILPTATQYARNALFAGLMPSEIQNRMPDKWISDTDDEGKNLYEQDFLADQLQRLGKKDLRFSYHKVTNHAFGKKLVDNVFDLLINDFNAVVYNFVDMLSHARTDTKLIRELTDNDKAYRSLTLSWFQNSPVLDMLKILSDKNIKVIITTDHGTINVTEPTKLIGHRNVNTNIRYKVGRGMSYRAKDVYEIKNPRNVYLSKPNINSVYVFARENLFFAYPNNFNQYVRYYHNTYQHGSISLEEMIIPFVTLIPKS